MNTADWTKKDYLAFALLYASSIDAEVDEDELALIDQVVGHDVSVNIHKSMKNLSDYECLLTIENERSKFFPGEDGKEALLAELEQLFKADGHFAQIEQMALYHLRRVL